MKMVETLRYKNQFKPICIFFCLDDSFKCWAMGKSLVLKQYRSDTLQKSVCSLNSLVFLTKVRRFKLDTKFITLEPFSLRYEQERRTFIKSLALWGVRWHLPTHNTPYLLYFEVFQKQTFFQKSSQSLPPIIKWSIPKHITHTYVKRDGHVHKTLEPV